MGLTNEAALHGRVNQRVVLVPVALVLEVLGEGLAVPHVVHRKLARPLGVGVASLDRVVAKVDRLVARVERERPGAEPRTRSEQL